MTARNQKIAIVLILFSVIALRLFLLYWGYVYDKFLVPPGDDPASHLGIIQAIIDTGRYFNPGSYPPGFHALVVLVAKLFHLDPLRALIDIGPIMAILPVIALYVVGRWFFNPLTGLLAGALAALAATGPVLQYADGNYPDMLAGGFFLVLALGFYLNALHKQPYLNFVAFLAVAMLTGLTHHLSFVLLVVIVVFCTIVLAIDSRFFGHKPPNLKKMASLGLAALAICLLAVMPLYGKTLILPAINSLIHGQPPGRFDQYLLTPPSLGQYPEIIGGSVWALGVVGLLFLLVNHNKVKRETKILIACWVAVEFLLSRWQLSGLPSRFARELFIPLSLTAGYLVASTIDQAPSRFGRLALGGLIAGFVVINTPMLFTGPFVLPEGFSRLVRFWPEDKEKIEILRSLPEGSKIAGTPSSPYYPLFLGKQTYVITTSHEGFQYFFIGTKPRSNPDGKVYPYYSNFDHIRQALIAYPSTETIYRFPDGAELRKILPE